MMRHDAPRKIVNVTLSITDPARAAWNRVKKTLGPTQAMAFEAMVLGTDRALQKMMTERERAIYLADLFDRQDCMMVIKRRTAQREGLAANDAALDRVVAKQLAAELSEAQARERGTVTNGAAYLNGNGAHAPRPRIVPPGPAPGPAGMPIDEPALMSGDELRNYVERAERDADVDPEAAVEREVARSAFGQRDPHDDGYADDDTA